ncbi:hypothetical protein V6N12_050934 [Hibiscus sabdariffa]|uniref:Uncharacterized protein n=1 Tax=Hibiscus sabdariffa TaxID=183260 RepID=A0ABR2GDV8_9ROSI
MVDLAAATAAEAGSEDTEDNGSITTPEATPMVSPPQSKARYKSVATKPTPKVKDGSCDELTPFVAVSKKKRKENLRSAADAVA